MILNKATPKIKKIFQSRMTNTMDNALLIADYCERGRIPPTGRLRLIGNERLVGLIPLDKKMKCVYNPLAQLFASLLKTSSKPLPTKRDPRHTSARVVCKN